MGIFLKQYSIDFGIINKYSGLYFIKCQTQFCVYSDIRKAYLIKKLPFKLSFIESVAIVLPKTTYRGRDVKKEVHCSVGKMFTNST